MAESAVAHHDACMSWPPPTTTNAAPTAPPTAQPQPKQPPELVRLLRSVAPATWVALLGGALVLIASAIVTASNWATVGLVARALALTAVCVGLGFEAPRLRRTAPTTATVIAHIAAAPRECPGCGPARGKNRGTESHLGTKAKLSSKVHERHRGGKRTIGARALGRPDAMAAFGRDESRDGGGGGGGGGY